VESAIIPSSTIVIPSKNGRGLLEDCLPAMQRAIGVAGGEHRILVVDDDSSDGTVGFLATAFPAVDVLPLTASGFGRATNSGVVHAQTESVVLLNNDVVVEPEFLVRLLEALIEPQVFAVGAKFLSGEGTLDFVLGNRTRAFWRHGMLDIEHVTDPMQLTKRCPQFFAQGAAMACWRQQYIDLGGFDSLYEPFYWEDVDLSYRAWKRGWRVLYEPKAVCRHFQSATTARDHRARYLKRISQRNAHLFLWKNLTDRRLFARHLSLAPLRAASDVFLGADSVQYGAFIAALRRIGMVITRRAAECSSAVVSDAEILRQTNG
jgi:O-antigen biosynthesis protein